MGIITAHTPEKESPGGNIKAIFPSAIGVDVHAKVLVCNYQWYDFETQAPQNERAEFGTSQTQLAAFAEWAKSRDPDRIVMESTGVLWRSPYQALEDCGFTSQKLVLANACDVKGKKGHKTDVIDAEHLATLGRLDAVKGSFVPIRAVRDMRLISRAYIRARQDLSRAKNRKTKYLNAIGARAGSVFSDINGKAAREILAAWVEDNPRLEEIIHAKAKLLKHSAEEIADALSPLQSEHRRMLKIQQNQIDVLEGQCDEWFKLLTEMQQPFQECIDRLMSIPHLKEISARLIFAEIGPDLSSFTSCEKFCSWAGVCPGVKESAGKRIKGVKSGKGNQWLKYVLVELCSGIALTKCGFLREYFQKLKERRGRNRAVVALAHKVLRIIYSLFKNLGTYIESTQELLKQFRARRLARAALQAARENLTLASGVVCDRTTGEVYK